MTAFTQSENQTAEDMRRQLTEKAAEDLAFREQLVSDPKGAIQQVFGIQVPDDIVIRVHEDDMHTLNLVLPPSPNLDEEQLEKVAGGLYSSIWWCRPVRT